MTSFALLETILVLLCSGIAAAFLFASNFSQSNWWRAMVTPLASIIGSGFLVLGPILVREFGQAAPLVMLALCALAYLFGVAIRFNIRHYESIASLGSKPIAVFENISSWTLALAYIISVAYYLNLMGAFAISLGSHQDAVYGKLIATFMFLFVGFFGVRSGLKKLEDMEQVSVTIKLAIIGGLLVAMSLFVGRLQFVGSIVKNPVPELGLNSLYLAFGLVVCVQGFETSRYLQEKYDSNTRIQTMRHAQWLSTIIYVFYTAMICLSFASREIEAKETVIISMTTAIAPILPAVLVAGALVSQFSAAVADTVGCGGLVNELTKNRVSSRMGYLAVVSCGLLLTWSTDIFLIIAYASRAFATYYGFQAVVAGLIASKENGSPLSSKPLFFFSLAVLAFTISITGVPIEG